MKKYQAYIDGQWVDPTSAQWFDTANPFTPKLRAQIPRCNQQDIERAAQIFDKSPRSKLTANQRGARNIYARVRAGAVWVNAYRIVKCMPPFGHCKSSSLGRKIGQAQIYEPLQARRVCINTNKEIASPFVME